MTRTMETHTEIHHFPLDARGDTSRRAEPRDRGGPVVDGRRAHDRGVAARTAGPGPLSRRRLGSGGVPRRRPRLARRRGTAARPRDRWGASRVASSDGRLARHARLRGVRLRVLRPRRRLQRRLPAACRAVHDGDLRAGASRLSKLDARGIGEDLRNDRWARWLGGLLVMVGAGQGGLWVFLAARFVVTGEVLDGSPSTASTSCSRSTSR